MKWFEIARIVLGLIPALIGVIQSIEEAIPGKGKGEQKLTAIKEVMIGVDKEANLVWPALERTIGIFVNLFNVNKIFKK